MLIGVPKEIKDNEFRVGLTPSSVAELVHHGHQVLVEAGRWNWLWPLRRGVRGGGCIDRRRPGFDFADADMIVKVKEPLAVERKMLRRGQILFTYLHLAPDRRRPTTASRGRHMHRL